MKKLSFIAISVFVAVFSSGAAFGQSLSSGARVSSAPPAVHHTNAGVNANALVLEAASTSRYTQLTTLKQIEKLMGKRPQNLRPALRSAVYAALSRIARSGIGLPAVSANSVVNSFPLIRMRACRDIGLLGGTRAKQILLEVLRSDTSPFVLSEAVYQLGGMIRKPDSSFSLSLAGALRRNISRPSEDIFVYTALLTIDRLVKAGALAPNSSLYSEILLMGKLGYGYSVDHQASSTILTLLSTG